MIASHQCEGIRVCPRRKRLRVPFASPAEHYIAGQPEGQSSPKVMTYRLPRYATGHDCDLKSYKTEFEDKNLYWSCAQSETSYTEQPTLIRTIGGTGQVWDADEKAPALPFNMTLPESAYTLDEAAAIIDAE